MELADDCKSFKIGLAT